MELRLHKRLVRVVLFPFMLMQEYYFLFVSIADMSTKAEEEHKKYASILLRGICIRGEWMKLWRLTEIYRRAVYTVPTIRKYDDPILTSFSIKGNYVLSVFLPCVPVLGLNAVGRPPMAQYSMGRQSQRITQPHISLLLLPLQIWHNGFAQNTTWGTSYRLS